MNYILITGGTSGIGFELARCFSAEGRGIIVVSSNIGRLEETKEKLEKEFDVPIICYEQDLSVIGAASELYHKIRNDNLNVTTLVNNAGFGLAGGTAEIDMDQEERMLVLNMINLVELCKLFIVNMYVKGSGQILNVASTGAFQPGPYSSTYFASKAFVLSYSRAIRYEAKKKGVNVSVLCPGATRTNFFDKEGVATPKNALSAEVVADYGYVRFMKKKEMIVPGLYNKVQRLIPQNIKMAIIARMKMVKS